MYKVFFNDRAIILSSPSEKMVFNEDEHIELTEDKASVNKTIDRFLRNPKERSLTILSASTDELLKWFRSFFINMDAAGGLVSNQNNELLCIHRLGRWDLPKGKVEKGETIQEAALREVEEECSLSGVELGRFATFTLHGYPHPKKTGKWILKTTHWYFMTYSGDGLPKPQESEQIDDVVWTPSGKLDRLKEHTYNSLLPVFDLWINSSKHLK